MKIVLALVIVLLSGCTVTVNLVPQQPMAQVQPMYETTVSSRVDGPVRSPTYRTRQLVEPMQWVEQGQVVVVPHSRIRPPYDAGMASTPVPGNATPVGQLQCWQQRGVAQC